MLIFKAFFGGKKRSSILRKRKLLARVRRDVAATLLPAALSSRDAYAQFDIIFKKKDLLHSLPAADHLLRQFFFREHSSSCVHSFFIIIIIIGFFLILFISA
jgi:hypothetical protein